MNQLFRPDGFMAPMPLRSLCLVHLLLHALKSLIQGQLTAVDLEQDVIYLGLPVWSGGIVYALYAIGEHLYAVLHTELVLKLVKCGDPGVLQAIICRNRSTG